MIRLVETIPMSYISFFSDHWIKITNRSPISVDCYPGQVQFFFSHKVDLPDGELEHNLAFIQWYQPVNSRYYFSIKDDEICNVELWGTEFYPEGRDCIIPVHNILSRFVPIKYKISDRKNAKEYLAVNPVNRKFNIR
ncbi:hypothetical protein GLOIN_2v1786477 [Rhizophagus irregularis DAOM 181602=DAOM 197198]|nr:hypothetical protein GLOIN_2v1786477 [Rhizophagus irregularis DAOM 181602=DAOM 197198]